MSLGSTSTVTKPEEQIDALVADLEQRVERRRNDGSFPSGIEEQLESRFAALRRDAANRQNFDPLTAALENQRSAAHFSRDRITTQSRLPGGAAVHNAAGAVVRRQIDGLLDQMQQFSDAVLATSELLGSMLSDPPFHHHDDLRGDLDMVEDRLVELERRRVQIEVVAQRVTDLERQIRRVSNSVPDIDWGRFAERFRGESDALLAHYAPVADRFVGLGPVVDIGCGDGDFLTLLAERKIDAWGVEADEALADAARDRGHHVRHGDGMEVLSNLGDDSVGGIVLLQVVEHLGAPVLPDLVVEARRVLRSGGVLLMETPNPRSLYVHTHSFWLDPSHVRPIHPLYLEHLCVEAGFASVEIEYSSEVPEDERLEPVPDDGSETAAATNRNIERLNDALFGPQDYAVVATA